MSFSSDYSSPFASFSEYQPCVESIANSNEDLNQPEVYFAVSISASCYNSSSKTTSSCPTENIGMMIFIVNSQNYILPPNYSISLGLFTNAFTNIYYIGGTSFSCPVPIPIPPSCNNSEFSLTYINPTNNNSTIYQFQLNSVNSFYNIWLGVSDYNGNICPNQYNNLLFTSLNIAGSSCPITSTYCSMSSECTITQGCPSTSNSDDDNDPVKSVVSSSYCQTTAPILVVVISFITAIISFIIIFNFVTYIFSKTKSDDEPPVYGGKGFTYTDTTPEDDFKAREEERKKKDTNIGAFILKVSEGNVLAIAALIFCILFFVLSLLVSLQKWSTKLEKKCPSLLFDELPSSAYNIMYLIETSLRDIIFSFSQMRYNGSGASTVTFVANFGYMVFQLHYILVTLKNEFGDTYKKATADAAKYPPTSQTYKALMRIANASESIYKILQYIYNFFVVTVLKGFFCDVWYNKFDYGGGRLFCKLT